MRVRFVLLAAAFPIAGAFAAHGCSDEPPFEDACQWLADPENCFAEFHADMLRIAGPNNVDNPNGDCSTFAVGAPMPTQASPTDRGTPNGSFQMRAMLGTCILSGGGQVTVAPPIDLTMFPMSPYADPVTYTFTFLAEDGNTCGLATYTSPHGFSITVNPPPDAGTTASGDAGIDAPEMLDAGNPEFTDAAPFIPYGSYTQVNPAGRDSFDVTCPTGESHHFTLDQINLTDPSAGACPNVAALLPTASMQIFLGGVDTPGALSFAISYPPPQATFDTAASYGASPAPDTVVYFNCTIPAQLETCVDGVKNGLETDIDCGGPQIPSKTNCNDCPARCQVGQNCLCDNDCGGGNVCSVNPSSGMRACGPAVVDGGVVAHFGNCAYEPDAGPVCMSSSSAGAGGGSPASTSTSTSSSSSGMGGAGGSGAGGAPTDGGSDG